MDFKAADGSNVDFDDNAGRLLSETDVVNICKRDYGFTPTAEEVEAIAGGFGRFLAWRGFPFHARGCCLIRHNVIVNK
jgi:hypothetical protein